MRCLYEVLEVERTADDTELKKAYRKLALVWHPDKNIHRLEEAEARFKEIQNAYEILSDPQERAWYDSHREQILRADDNYQQGQGEYAQEKYRPNIIASLFKYFNKSCFTDFSDKPKGFYKVYSKVFDNIAKEELKAAEGSSEIQEKLPSIYPSFGKANSDLQNVKQFYQIFVNFTTVMDFSWADTFNVNRAPDKKTRKVMEKENQKERQREKLSYQDTVRQLAEFVKKRDPRVIKLREEEQRKRDEQLKQEKERQKQLKQEKYMKAQQYEDPEWVKQSEMRYKEDELTEESDQEIEQFYCVVCDKVFKSERALTNHEKSKKHKQMAELLKDDLITQETIYEEDPQHDLQNEEEDYKQSEIKCTDENINIAQKAKSKNKNQYNLNQEDQNDNYIHQNQNSKQNKKNKNKKGQNKQSQIQKEKQEPDNDMQNGVRHHDKSDKVNKNNHKLKSDMQNIKQSSNSIDNDNNINQKKQNVFELLDDSEEESDLINNKDQHDSSKITQDNYNESDDDTVNSDNDDNESKDTQIDNTSKQKKMGFQTLASDISNENDNDYNNDDGDDDYSNDNNDDDNDDDNNNSNDNINSNQSSNVKSNGDTNQLHQQDDTHIDYETVSQHKQSKKKSKNRNQNEKLAKIQQREQQESMKQLGIDLNSKIQLDQNLGDNLDIKLVLESDGWEQEVQRAKKGKKSKSKNQKNSSQQNIEKPSEDITQRNGKGRQKGTKNLLCSVCNQDFQSKNKLFEHIKKEGHAAYKT